VRHNLINFGKIHSYVNETLLFFNKKKMKNKSASVHAKIRAINTFNSIRSQCSISLTLSLSLFCGARKKTGGYLKHIKYVLSLWLDIGSFLSSFFHGGKVVSSISGL